MSQSSGTELYMLHMRHIRNDKFQDSFIELHPDRALNNLNGVLRKSAMNKFVLTTSGYKYCINHVDNNQYVLLEIIKVETNFFFEIDAMDFILQNSANSEGGGESRYAMYESKKTDQLLADVEAMRRAEQQALSIDFDYEEVSGTNPVAKNRKLPHVAEYGQVLLDSNKAVAQSGPYGFARQHGHSPKSRNEAVNRRSSEPDRITSPSIPAAHTVTTPQASGIPVRRSSGVTFSEAHVVHHDNRSHDPSPMSDSLSSDAIFAATMAAATTSSTPPPVEVTPAPTNGHKLVEMPHHVTAASSMPPKVPSAVEAAHHKAPTAAAAHPVATTAAATTTTAERRPSLTSGLTAEEKQSAADKLFQKYGMKKASFTASAAAPRSSFNAGDAAAVVPAPNAAPSAAASSHSSQLPPRPESSSHASTASAAAQTAQPKSSADVTHAANRLFEKYNRSPEGQSPSVSNNSISTAPAAAPVVPVAPVAPSTPAAAAAPVVLMGAPLPAASPHFSMASLFGQPEAESLTVVKSELVHHPTVIKAPDGSEVRSIGGFRRVKSIVIAEDHDDYGDLSRLKDITEESSVSTIGTVSTTSTLQPIVPKPAVKTGSSASVTQQQQQQQQQKELDRLPSVTSLNVLLPAETSVKASAPSSAASNTVKSNGSAQHLPVPAVAPVTTAAPPSVVVPPVVVAAAPPVVAPVVPAAAPVVVTPAPVLIPAPLAAVAPPVVAPTLPAVASFKAPTLIAAPTPYLTPSTTAAPTAPIVSSTPEPRPTSARNSVTFANTVVTPAPAARPAAVVAAATPQQNEENQEENDDGGKLRRPSSMFSANPFDMLKKPVVDNATDEERQATQSHESSRTNHYSKLGSAFVSENVLAGGRGGRGGGRGRGMRTSVTMNM